MTAYWGYRLIEVGVKLEAARSFLDRGEKSLQRLRSNFRLLLPIDRSDARLSSFTPTLQ
jgi:hypothetical protein